VIRPHKRAPRVGIEASVTGEGMRRGLQDWISDRSEGQRYALALGLNLSFVAIVIAGFALLYLSGFDPGGFADRDAPPDEPVVEVAEATDLDASEPNSDRLFSDSARFSITAARDAYEQSLDGTANAGPPDDLVEFEPIDSGSDDAPDGNSDTDGAAPADVAGEPNEPVESSDASGGPIEVADAADAEGAAPDTASSNGAELGEPAGSDVDAVPVEAAPVAAPAEPAENSIGSLWAAAGELAAQLEREFPCGRFVLSAGSGGAPRLEGRVGAPGDRTAALARISALFSGDADVELGLGCTASIGGGYVGLTDERGRIMLVTEADLSAPMRAVLPREGTCAVMGEVINLSEPLRNRLGSDGGSGGASGSSRTNIEAQTTLEEH